MLVLVALALGLPPVVREVGAGRVNWTTLDLCAGASASNSSAALAGFDTLEGQARASLGPLMLDLSRLVAFDDTRTTGDLMAAAESTAEKLDSNVSLWSVNEARYFTSGRVEVDVCLPIHAWLRPALTQGAEGQERGSPATLPWTGVVIDARGLPLEPAVAAKVVNPAGLTLYSLRSMAAFAASQHPPVAYVTDPADLVAVRRAGEHPLIVPAESVVDRVNVQVGAGAGRAIEDAAAGAGFLSQGRVVIVVDP